MIQEGLGLSDQVYSHFLKEWLKEVLGDTLTGACPWHPLWSLDFRPGRTRRQPSLVATCRMGSVCKVPFQALGLSYFAPSVFCPQDHKVPPKRDLFMLRTGSRSPSKMQSTQGMHQEVLLLKNLLGDTAVRVPEGGGGGAVITPQPRLSSGRARHSRTLGS